VSEHEHEHTLIILSEGACLQIPSLLLPLDPLTPPSVIALVPARLSPPRNGIVGLFPPVWEGDRPWG